MSKKRKKTLVLHVFLGGMKGVQVEAFTVAISALLIKFKNVDVFYLTTSQLRAKHTPKTFVDWLLLSDIHFILSHVHQSTRWNCRHIAHKFSRLIGHPGFPAGQQLLCSIFLQNKFVYLNALPFFCNHSVKIPLPWLSSSRAASKIEMLSIICEGEGYVVKTPFTTNCELFKICRTLEQVCLVLLIWVI